MESAAAQGSVAMVTVVLMTYVFHARHNALSGYQAKSKDLPKDCVWLDQSSFEVFTSILDTIVPSNSLADLRGECAKSAVCSVYGDEPPATDSVLSLERLLKNGEDWLRMGAIDINADTLSAMKLQMHGASHSLREVYILLKVLSTSVGSFFLTGYPVPFQVRALSHVQCFSIIQCIMLLFPYFQSNWDLWLEPMRWLPFEILLLQVCEPLSRFRVTLFTSRNKYLPAF